MANHITLSMKGVMNTSSGIRSLKILLLRLF